MATVAGKSADDLVDDGGVFGLLDVVIVAVIAIGEIGGKLLQGGGEPKSEIASYAAGMDGLFLAFYDAVEIIIPGDALI